LRKHLMRGMHRLLCFFSSRRRHTRSKRDWSSDVCSSDLKVTWMQNLFLPSSMIAGFIALLLGPQVFGKLIGLWADEGSMLTSGEIGRACVGKEGRSPWAEYEGRERAEKWRLRLTCK